MSEHPEQSDQTQSAATPPGGEPEQVPAEAAPTVERPLDASPFGRAETEDFLGADLSPLQRAETEELLESERSRRGSMDDDDA